MPNPFHEGSLSKPIRDLGLAIAGTALEPVIAEFREELERAGIRRLQPHFYLSDEWGVNFGTIGIAIPFYLAHPELIALHAEKVGHIEGSGRADLLRYLRHEMGHVVNYAYELYDNEDWIKTFGSMTQPYEDDYHPEPFSRRHVTHLPGWYAQKHPDEDWAETFAVWLTPGSTWRAVYADWPDALAKLEFCDRTMEELNQRDPPVTLTELDELTCTVEEYYEQNAVLPDETFPPGLDGSLQAIFEDYGSPETPSAARREPAAALIHRVERDLMANIYRWTGHFPERTRPLLRHLAGRAAHLKQVYPVDREGEVLIALTTLVTALAMNHVLKGSYWA